MQMMGYTYKVNSADNIFWEARVIAKVDSV